MTGSSIEQSALPHADSAQWQSLLKAFSVASTNAFPGAPDWWRSQASAKAQQISHSGLPTTRLEDWKYTNLVQLHARDRKIALGPVDVQGPEGIQVLTLSQIERAASSDRNLIGRVRKALSNETGGFTGRLCRALVADPFVICVPEGLKSAEPIEITWKALPEGFWSMGAVVVDVGPGSKVSIVERYGRGVDAQSILSLISVGAGASVTHLRSQQGAGKADVGVVTASAHIDVAEGATYHGLQVSSGSCLSREDLEVDLLFAGAKATADGVYIGKGKQVLDHHTSLCHRVGDTQSEQLYKGILSDESRGVFNGRIAIAKNARGANSSQMNRNLLLSKKVEIDTKPQLEIENDDVKAAHGAAIGRLDAEHVFYLQTRGIAKAQAIEILASGFAYDVIDRIEDIDETIKLRELAKACISDALVGLTWGDA
jgi:Fe-S cluster assembly protein SufD